MFESDDYDQILSQFEFPNLPKCNVNDLNKSEHVNSVGDKDLERVNLIKKNEREETNLNIKKNLLVRQEINLSSRSENILDVQENVISPQSPPGLKQKDCLPNLSQRNGIADLKVSPKQSKRKIIDSHFDYNSKRKFPGPAGLLTGRLTESKDESVCQLELFSQDIDFSQNSLKTGLFELPMWNKLKKDVVTWNLSEVDTIKGIKQQAVAGNLRRRKAQTVTAFVESVDRSAIDPLIVLRDATGNIKCTLHRDAWSLFSPYLVAEQCALVLWKPTVLTTGSAFKKHYLNITLSNIYAIFSSAILQNEAEVTLPDGYIKDCENNFTIIRIKESPESLAINAANNDTLSTEQNLLDDLDSIFSDELF